MTDGITEAAQNGENEEQQPQVKYGISLLKLENDEIVVHVTGDPDLGQLQRMLAGGLANLNADITARKTVQAIEAMGRKPKIIRP